MHTIQRFAMVVSVVCVLTALLHMQPVRAGPLHAESTWALVAWGEAKPVDLPSATTSVVIVDLFEAEQADIDAYTRAGHRVVCYYSAGTAEDWRDDVKADKEAWENLYVGSLAQWGDEVWLDIYQLDALKDLMGPRLELAADKGCHGVEPDNTDCFSNTQECDVGGSKADRKAAQLAYNKWTAEFAHSLDLLVGLKNSGLLVEDLAPVYDFSVVEQCLQYKECGIYAPFIDLDKPVFAIEYQGLSKQDCAKAEKEGVRMKHCDGSSSSGTCKNEPLKDCFEQLEELDGNDAGVVSTAEIYHIGAAVTLTAYMLIY